MNLRNSHSCTSYPKSLECTRDLVVGTHPLMWVESSNLHQGPLNLWNLSVYAKTIDGKKLMTGDCSPIPSPVTWKKKWAVWFVVRSIWEQFILWRDSLSIKGDCVSLLSCWRKWGRGGLKRANLFWDRLIKQANFYKGDSHLCPTSTAARTEHKESTRQLENLCLLSRISH